jgi:hypothetical protein
MFSSRAVRSIPTGEHAIPKVQGLGGVREFHLGGVAVHSEEDFRSIVRKFQVYLEMLLGHVRMRTVLIDAENRVVLFPLVRRVKRSLAKQDGLKS